MRLPFCLLVLSMGLVSATWNQFKSDNELLNHVRDPFRLEDLSSFKDGLKFWEHQTPTDDPDDVKFYFYNNPRAFDDFYEMDWNNKASLQKLPWIVGAPVKILIHGFTQSQNSSMPGMIKNAYLENMLKGDSERVNIIVVDWGRLAASPKFSVGQTTYTNAVRNVEVAGRRVGELILNLNKFSFSPFHNIHCIGFSLGAHVCGWSGLTVKRRTETEDIKGSKIGRLTGLDPAGPAFYIEGIFGRELDREDAIFVDIIHTSWGSYGIAKKLGHVEFFPNRGDTLLQTQPFCDAVVFTLRPIQVCSHNMAPLFYAMSILRDYQACQSTSYNQFLKDRREHCDEMATFGEHCERTARDDFYLEIPRPWYLNADNKLRQARHFPHANKRQGVSSNFMRHKRLGHVQHA